MDLIVVIIYLFIGISSVKYITINQIFLKFDSLILFIFKNFDDFNTYLVL